MINWQEIDTLLLDMDGTILDLAFDNYFWRELVPRCMARARAADFDSARRELTERYAKREGSLDWYCLDYWSDALALDLRALKAASSHRISYLPGARDCLARLAASGVRLALVTNAHGTTLEIKRGVAGLDRYFDEFVTSHDVGRAKEDPGFWPVLRDVLDFDPQRTAFVDDSPAVLATARQQGLADVIAVRRPDSSAPPRDAAGDRSVESLAELDPVWAADRPDG
jgi:HAD superfamily hydrolase (TIGR01509 family)